MASKTTKESNFDLLYETKLLDSLKDIEAFRIKSRKILIAHTLIGLSICLMFVFCMKLGINSQYIALFLVIGLFVIGIGGVRTSSTKTKIKRRYKKEIILTILKDLYEDIEYIPKQKIATKTINKSLLLQHSVTTTIGDDYVRCRIGDCIVQFCEIEAYKYFIESQRMFYAGIFMIVSFNKSFKSKTIVIPEKLSNTIAKLKLSIKGNMIEPSTVKLEDPEFEKRFIVISEDQVEARYLLSTSLMKRLYDYDTKFKGKASFSFIDNNLYVSIPIKQDMFEPNYSSSNLDRKQVEFYYTYFKSITGIIEELDLNTQIWL